MSHSPQGIAGSAEHLSAADRLRMAAIDVVEAVFEKLRERHELAHLRLSRELEHPDTWLRVSVDLKRSELPRLRCRLIRSTGDNFDLFDSLKDGIPSEGKR